MIYFYCSRPSDGLKSLRTILKHEYKQPSLKIGEDARPKKNHLIINWGSTHIPRWDVERVLNHPKCVAVAVNKLDAFKCLEENGVSIPPFTTDKNIVKEWLQKHTVFARTILNGSGGKGIVEIVNDIPDAPLYVKYIPKRKEFRVHVINSKVVDVQEKRKKREFDGERDTKIRNVANGYVFTREDVVQPDNLVDEALKAVKALGLFFGAVDIIWNQKNNKCFVLEVNTAPGLEGTTLLKYAEALHAIR